MRHHHTSAQGRHGGNGDDRTGSVDHALRVYALTDTVLQRARINKALARLTPRDRDIVILKYAYERPQDYKGPWPPRLIDIGCYVAQKHEGAGSVRMIQVILDRIHGQWKRDQAEREHQRAAGRNGEKGSGCAA